MSLGSDTSQSPCPLRAWSPPAPPRRSCVPAPRGPADARAEASACRAFPAFEVLGTIKQAQEKWSDLLDS